MDPLGGLTQLDILTAIRNATVSVHAGNIHHYVTHCCYVHIAVIHKVLTFTVSSILTKEAAGLIRPPVTVVREDL